MSTSWRLAVDVGGTFIDYILLDEETGEIYIDKQPSTAQSLVDEFMTGLERLPAKVEDLSMFIHGTTVAINTLVQERGAKTGLLTTEGFRDVLELGRAGRPEIYDLRYLPAEPLVPRYLRREIPGRLGADGREETPLDMHAVATEVDYLVTHGVEAIAICLLHSYANPAHEQQIANYVRERHPELAVSVSNELVREWREFERTSTTVINGYTQPLFSNYARSIDERVRNAGYQNEIAFMRSNGGVMTIGAAGEKPVETLGSGPAGGVIGARALSEYTGRKNIVCADVGGTTYDVALIHDGEIVERSDTDIAGRPVMGSVIDIISVGAGGGSIASIDPDSGSLKVGPESAGAHPGPACFGKGGTRPAVTDAQVILGLLDPQRFLGGRMVLDKNKSEAAIREHLGQTGDVVQLAAGIMTIAQTNMANAIRVITTERGLDPKDFAMLSFGGGGGLFAAGVAEELGMDTVIVPQAAAGFSAWGMLTADYREDAVRTVVTNVTTRDFPEISKNFRSLEQEARTGLIGYGFPDEALEVAYSADVRYAGQDRTITTPLKAEWLEGEADELLGGLAAEFTRRHRQRYGHGEETAAIQIVTMRCRAIAPVQRPRPKGSFSTEGAQAVSHRPIWFEETGWAEQVPVYERDTMTAADTLAGPCVVDEWTTTVIVPPNWTAALDDIGNLVLTYAKAEAQ
ncbi:hydantoinase/oxoprolinase family protein [Nesterenkonia alba]|uniref:hydantoinase/oxoprolinase family protein n=1 Tax=Nesterenkonia alba TaxID=515814 RepID=UPI0003B3CB1C|nr:hydantoinase/oxoprolinase family protein [Nesterenkonia alba]